MVEGLLLLIPFLTTTVNPDVGLADGALMIAAAGVLMVTYDGLLSRANMKGRRRVRGALGWSVMSTGLLIAFGGVLWGSQVACMCPESVSCSCGEGFYAFVIVGGLALAAIGAAITTSAVRKRNSTELDEN